MNRSTLVLLIMILVVPTVAGVGFNTSHINAFLPLTTEYVNGSTVRDFYNNTHFLNNGATFNSWYGDFVPVEVDYVYSNLAMVTSCTNFAVTFLGWFDNAADKTILSKQNHQGNIDGAFVVNAGGSSVLSAYAMDDSANAYRGKKTAGAIGTGSWYHFAYTHNTTFQNGSFWVDGAIQYLDFSSGTFAGIEDMIDPVRIGTGWTAGAAYSPHDGRITNVTLICGYIINGTEVNESRAVN